MTVAQALPQLTAAGNPTEATAMAAYHKGTRPFLGIKVPVIDAMAGEWRADCTLDERLALADGLWRSDIHEARIAAAKLLTQARIRPDDGAWALIQTWVPDFDAWAIADHVCIAGQKRLVTDPTRLDDVEVWTRSPHMWTRRAALVVTLPWTKQNHPKPEEIMIRDRVLGWAATYVPDQDWFIQKAIAWWIRELSKHDQDRARGFMDRHGAKMKPFAKREARRYLP